MFLSRRSDLGPVAHPAIVIACMAMWVACAPSSSPRGLWATRAQSSLEQGLLAEVPIPAHDRQADRQADHQGHRQADSQGDRRARRALRQARERYRANDFALLGLSDLERDQLDEAVEALFEATRRGQDWRDHNDLSVALLTRGTRRDRPLDLLRALEANEEAATRAPHRHEPAYNRAVVLEALGLRLMARRAWQRAATVAPHDESRNAWSRQAGELAGPSRVARFESVVDAVAPGTVQAGTVQAEALKAVAQSWVVDAPFEARRFAQTTLLDRWCAARTPDAATRATTLGMALGEALARTRDDTAVADAFASLRTCEATTPERHGCRNAICTYVRGAEAFHAGHYEAAERALASALPGLEHHAPGLHAWARFFSIYTRSFGEVEPARRAFEALLDSVGYPSLRGRIHWRLGVLAGHGRRSAEALAHFERARAELERSSGAQGAAFTDVLVANELDLVGEVEQGWRHRVQALRALAGSGQHRRKHSALHEAAQALLGRRQERIARAFIDELVAHAEASGNPAYQAGALRERALLRARQRERRTAEADLAAARAVARTVGASDRRARLELDLDLAAAIVAVEHAPRSARDRLDAVVARAEANALRSLLIPAWTARARSARALGETDAAENDLRRALTLFEEQRAQATVETHAVALLGAQPTVDELTALLVASGRARAALSVTERARGRLLLDLRAATHHARAQPRDADAIQAGLPERVTLVTFAQLEDHLLAWVVTAHDLRLVRLPWTAEAARAEVAAFRSAIARARAGPDVMPAATRLFRALIQPLGLNLDPTRHLVLVPDQALGRLPFGALADPETGQFLGQATALIVSPSASLVVAGDPPSDHPHGMRSCPSPPVILHSPQLEDTPWSTLPTLTGARSEADMVARRYPTARVLSGPNATRDAFLTALDQDTSLLHIAAHAVANLDALHRSLLPLSGGAVTVADLLDRQRPIRPHLVVLSACSTLDGFEVEREGLLGLGGALFALGSDAVVASLWAVPDAETARFMTAFHDHRSTGSATASQAVRHAIDHLVTIGGAAAHPKHWSHFVVLETLGSVLEGAS